MERTGNRIWTPKRRNQHQQNRVEFDRCLIRVRQRIEGVFHELTNNSRDLESILAKTVIGLTTRVIAKLTGHVLKRLLDFQFGINVQTFEFAVSAV